MDNKLQYWIELNRVKLFYKIGLFSNFRYSPISDTQNWYVNVALYSNLKNCEKIKSNFNRKFNFLNGTRSCD